MRVYFIGAGPGASDLLTLRGARVLRAADLVLYAGSLIPPDMLQETKPEAEIVDTSALVLEQIISEMRRAYARGWCIARLHSGDPSLFGAIAEQIRHLKELRIPFEIIPGVPAFAASAAALGRELTVPGVSQSLILTRTSMQSSCMPSEESLENFAHTRATLALHLSIRNLGYITRTLAPFYGWECPTAVVYKASWPQQRILTGTLQDIRRKVRVAKITRTALVLVGRALQARGFSDSHLYSPHHVHLLRPHREDAGNAKRGEAQRTPETTHTQTNSHTSAHGRPGHPSDIKST